MFGVPAHFEGREGLLPPAQYKDSARHQIYKQLPKAGLSLNTSVRSAPSQFLQQLPSQKLHRLLALSVFSWGKRSVRLAPSIYSSSTATIPEDSEQTTTTVEQLINDVALHENYVRERWMAEHGPQEPIDVENYKISLGSDLSYQNVPELLVDWNLNVTRCKLMVTAMPIVSSSPDLQYLNNALPQLVGDLAEICQLVLLGPHITDTEFIKMLYTSTLYTEHSIDHNFKKTVAEISVKQSRLLQISSPKRDLPSPPITPAEHSFLSFQFKEIALRNYLVNLAAAATTAYEYKIKSDALKKELRRGGDKRKLSKDEKKQLWDSVRLDVFKRAGLEE